MRFYTEQHPFYCGVDLHAKTMYVCILDGVGEVKVHRNIRTEPARFLRLIEPYREGIVVGVECLFSWYWLADLCAEEGIDFVLGHALYMRAIHGAKSSNDKIDSLKIASLLRGGNFPFAYVYPRGMRATRDLLRRRLYFTRKRSQLITHIRNTNYQYNLPPIKARIDSMRQRVLLPNHFPDADVRKSIEADVAMLDSYDPLLADLERYIHNNVKKHDPESFRLLRTVPGIGEILALTILYEIHDISRFPTVQDFVSYSRLVRCRKESAGKRKGFGGQKIGNVHLKWAFSEAAVHFVSYHPNGKKIFAGLERKHGKAKAYSVLAHKLGRAVYRMLKKRQPYTAEKIAA